MLKKLLKYDLKYTFKVLIVFYILSLFFAVLTRILFNIDDSFIMSIIAKISSGTVIAMIVNCLINNIIRLWVRFKNNLYGDESYLTHTLPVDKKNIYLSKILTSIITLFTSMIVIAITLFIAYYSKENIELIKNLLLLVADIYDVSIILMIVVMLFIVFLEIFNLLQSGYIGMIIGHMMNNYKFGLSILFGFITYLVSQFFVLISLFICALFNKDIMNLFITNEIINVDMVKTIIYMSLFTYSVTAIINYLVNLNLFKKGVNVD